MADNGRRAGTNSNDAATRWDYNIFTKISSGLRPTPPPRFGTGVWGREGEGRMGEGKREEGEGERAKGKGGRGKGFEG